MVIQLSVAAISFRDVQNQLGLRTVEQLAQQRLAIAQQLDFMPQHRDRISQSLDGFRRIDHFTAESNQARLLWLSSFGHWLDTSCRQ